MKSLFRKWLCAYLKKSAMETGRFAGLYRRICRPPSAEWATFLKRRNFLYAMGDNCVVNPNVTFTDPKHVRLGNNVNLTGCTLIGHDGAVNMIKTITKLPLNSVGKIDILDNVFVGHGSIILPDVTIGPYAIVAAGSVVTKDVPSNCIVGGVPAKVIGTVDAYVERLKERTAQQPWANSPLISGDFLGPATEELTKLRCEYFFGTGKSDDSAS